MATDDGNFFSRWSRRKAQVAAATLPPVPADPAPPAAATGTEQVPTPAAQAAPTAPAATTPPECAVASPAVDPGQSPPPTLEDVAGLTPASDFKPFVGRAVPAQVTNAAMKKLFADPHFNVMDGLDIYIDDYSQPNPLPAALLKKMVSAQFMKLVEAEAEAPSAQAQTQVQPAPMGVPSGMPSPPTVLTPPVLTPTPAPAHDHLDLQLQPDHATRRGGSGPGTE